MMCVSAHTNLLAFDADLPNRDEFLDKNLMSRRLGEILNISAAKCEIVRAKYQINSSLRLLYSVESENAPKFVSARIYAGSPAGTNYFVFPNDRKIHGLSVISNPPKSFPGFWKSSKIVAYAPEKCLTMKCLDEAEKIFAYAKIYAEKEFETGEKVFRFLAEQSARNLFPKVLGFDDENKILMLENVVGNRLANLDKSLNTQAFRMLGKAIGELHGVQTKVSLPAFQRLSPRRIQTALKTISYARPDCKIQAEKLAENLLKIYAFGNEEKVVLHGDVHPKNGILGENGTLTLIDFDQLSYGNPAAEIGSFLAGLFYKETIGFDDENERRKYTKSFLRGYAEIRDLPSGESLNWHTAAALFTERASRSITRIRTEGLQNFARILTASEQILAGGIL